MRSEPPGPAGLPVVGNTHQYARDPFRFMDGVRRAYGDVARFDLGPYDTYMLSHPDLVERVLVRDDRLFRKADFQDRAVSDLLGNGLLLSEGSFWREQRQLAQPAFAPDRVAGLVDMMADRTAATLDRWGDGDVVDLHTAMAELTVEIIVDAMFGATIDRDTVRTVQENLDPLGARFEPDPLGFLLPDWAPTRENRAYRNALDTIDGVLADLIDRRRADRRCVERSDRRRVERTDRRRANGSEDDDLLSILLRAHDRGEQTDAQVRDEMMTMLLAGHDTTALALTYAWHHVTRHPAVEDALYDEVDRVLGPARDGTADRDGRPTIETLGDLDYTERVVREALRLDPPVYTLFREPTTDVRLRGFRVPEGSLLMLPQWVVHRDAAFWDDPLAFDPDRWLPERSAGRHNYAYFPFGAGPRHCIGKQFSLVEARVIAAMMAQRFRLELVSAETIDRRPSLTMHPADPVEVRLHARD